VIVPNSTENYNYLEQTRDCTTQQKQYNYNYLVQTRDCITQWRKSPLPSTDTWLYNTAGQSQLPRTDVIVPHSSDSHNYLVHTRDCTTQQRQSQQTHNCSTQWGQSQLPCTDTWLYHRVEQITTTKYRHVIVPYSRANHNYLVQTRDCTTQQRQSQQSNRDTWLYHTVEKITTI